MYKDKAEQLVKALRSGEYTQGTQRLNGPNGFCCLGVACDLEFPDYWSVSNGPTNDRAMFGSVGTLPTEAIKVYGFKDLTGSFVSTEVEWPASMPLRLRDECSLTDLNDGGATFEHIADFIELNWEKL